MFSKFFLGKFILFSEQSQNISKDFDSIFMKTLWFYTFLIEILILNMVCQVLIFHGDSKILFFMKLLKQQVY